LNGRGSRVQPGPGEVCWQMRRPSTSLAHQYHGAGLPSAAVDAKKRQKTDKCLINMKNLLAK